MAESQLSLPLSPPAIDQPPAGLIRDMLHRHHPYRIQYEKQEELIRKIDKAESLNRFPLAVARLQRELGLLENLPLPIGKVENFRASLLACNVEWCLTPDSFYTRWVTDDLTLESLHLGTLRAWIVVNYGETAVYLDAHKNNNPSRGGNLHPHSDPGYELPMGDPLQKVCLGADGRNRLNSAIYSGHLDLAIELVRTALHQYNRNSPYCAISEWYEPDEDDDETTQCPCGNVASHFCEQCNTEVCDDCYLGNLICTDCGDTCSHCDEHCANENLRTCPSCDRLICDSCLGI